MHEEIIKKTLWQVSTQSYVLGIILGLLAGIAIGLALGHHFGSETTIVIPLTEGIKV